MFEIVNWFLFVTVYHLSLKNYAVMRFSLLITVEGIIVLNFMPNLSDI